MDNPSPTRLCQRFTARWEAGPMGWGCPSIFSLTGESRNRPLAWSKPEAVSNQEERETIKCRTKGTSPSSATADTEWHPRPPVGVPELPTGDLLTISRRLRQQPRWQGRRLAHRRGDLREGLSGVYGGKKLTKLAKGIRFAVSRSELWTSLILQYTHHKQIN